MSEAANKIVEEFLGCTEINKWTEKNKKRSFYTITHLIELADKLDQQNKENAIEFATYVLEQSDKQNEQFEDMYDTFLRIKEGDWKTKS